MNTKKKKSDFYYFFKGCYFIIKYIWKGFTSPFRFIIEGGKGNWNYDDNLP